MNPFNEIRDQFIKDIVGITDPFYSNAITALLFLAFILFMGYTIKLVIQDIKENKKSKGEKEEREKRFIQLFKNNTKIKDGKN